MCGYQVKDASDCSQSISLTIPERTVTDLRTLIIGCCESNSLPELDHWQELLPLASITMAGAKAFDPKLEDHDGLSFLSQLLETANKVEHLIVCFHSGCSYIEKPLESSQKKRRLRILKGVSSTSPDVTLSNDIALHPYEKQILEQLRGLATMIELEPKLRERKLVLQGWLYEPELDWTSFFDLDTGLLLPLSANTGLCNPQAKR